ncbi:hypothetical protein [Inhella gelatinilytica]|uniref:Uncharacterized protein n=1 Tax=Inhella gelatinilytica TaxID=2795030 RepID=A0A931IWQ1_9BURK|nr:hypothetical protein [Inhella gelatinilytica]MBH9553554.1 hypothetical protein [Inhella gelatinilytica]
MFEPHLVGAPAAPDPGPHPAAHARVARKLNPGSAGTLRWQRRFGPQQLGVRHRLSHNGRTRYTTVELLVAEEPVTPRTDRTVALRVQVHERDLQAALRAAGARWDPAAKLWRTPLRVARLLKLQARIVNES